jgi:hypothetical protein
MLPSYNFICVPLDTRDPAVSKRTFDLRIVSEIQFPMDTPHDPTTIRDVLNQHPILLRPPDQPLSAYVWDFRHWSSNGHSMDPKAATKIVVRFSGKKPLSDLHQKLMAYLGESKNSVTTAAIPHDGRYDNLPVDHFVDVSKAADDLKAMKHSLRISAIRNLNSVAQIRRRASLAAYPSGGPPDLAALQQTLERTSFALAKWIDASSHSALLEAIAEKDERKAQQLYLALGSRAPIVKSIRSAIDKVARRISVKEGTCPAAGETTKLTAVGTTGDVPINLADPNVAIHSAIKNPLIAESCGFVTTWSAVLPIPINGDLVIQLDLQPLIYDRAKVEVQPALATAFRRAGHTHPVSYSDLGSKDTHNSALACLNDRNGKPRYRATSVKAESDLVKQVILQVSNSLPGPSAIDSTPADGVFKDPLDLRPPQLLRSDQFGTAEPETSGVVFSAPAEDLIVPADLQKFASPGDRRTGLPCLFLEDLWIGYRLDLKEESRDKFNSIHRQQQDIAFTQSRDTVSGETEDYIEREQADDPARGYTSTDLNTYNGFSAVQAKNFLIFLGVDRPPVLDPNQPFTVTVVASEKTERLTFRHAYYYRLRNVFLGGISCDSADPQLEDVRFSERYRQRFPFFRARALRPGEVLSPKGGDQAATDSRGKTLYLTSDQPRASITLVPSPIDIDTSRFHGMLLSSKSEITSQKGRQYVSDLGKFFKTVPPSALNYFYDPDVYGVVIRPTVLNGNEQEEPEEFIYVDGTYCGLSRHIELNAVTETYGNDGDWQKFKPIVITFRTTDESPKVRHAGFLGDSRHVEVEIPPASEVHLSVVPLFNPILMRKTACHAASSAELADITSNPAAEDKFPIPAIAEQVIKVIHSVKRPRQAPALFCEGPRSSAGVPEGQSPCIAARKLDSEFANLFGRIELDAASTKEIRLEATWADVNDDPNQERYVLHSGTASTTPKSVLFREFTPVPPTAAQFRELFLAGSEGQPSAALLNYNIGRSGLGFVDQFGLQCIEDKVFLGPSPEHQVDDVKQNSTRINFKDQRRKLAKVEAVAVSRFTGLFTDNPGKFERRSNSVIVDVPSTVRMTAPMVSHIVPLRKRFLTGNNKSGTKVAAFSIRIYLRKQCFQSGIGERLAIGCAAGGEAPTSDGAETLKYITQWGEDPIERASLRSTMRTPRASDFTALGGTEEGDANFAEDLYPTDAVGGRTPVLYRDNVGLPETPGAQRRWVSVASYALRYDERQSLWYADVHIEGDFFGWCGMALYRHQPHSLPGRELSETSAWAYAAVLYGEPIAWVEKEDTLRVTIGPVYDKNVSFDLDSLEYREDVSQDLSDPHRLLHALKSYRVGYALYFEAMVPKKDVDWGLLKKRFGSAIASSPLNE